MTKYEWMTIFGSNLKEILAEKKMPQQKLAIELGVSRSAVSQYICGEKMPSIRVILNISYILDCDLYDLLDFGEPID